MSDVEHNPNRGGFGNFHENAQKQNRRDDRNHFQIQTYLERPFFLHFFLHLSVHLKTDAVLHSDVTLTDVIQLEKHERTDGSGKCVEEDGVIEEPVTGDNDERVRKSKVCLFLFLPCSRQ